MGFIDQTIPLKELKCGNCRNWSKCKGQPNPAKYNRERQPEDTACIVDFNPVIINGVEVVITKYS